MQLPEDVIQHMFLFLSHNEVYVLAIVSNPMKCIVSNHCAELRDIYLEPKLLDTSPMYESLPAVFHQLTDAAEFNYIREILPKLPPPPLHFAFTSDAGFPRSQPTSSSSLSDVAFRSLLLTSFLTTSMLSTVFPQHLNVLPAIGPAFENHQVRVGCSLSNILISSPPTLSLILDGGYDLLGFYDARAG